MPLLDYKGDFWEFLGCFLAANPLWSREVLGAWPVLNLLLPAYGVPALVLLWIASNRHRAPGWLRNSLGILGLLCAMLFVSLTVRHAFHGAPGPCDLRLSLALTQGEHYALSLAWGVLGAVLLVAGIFSGRPLLRYGALAVLLLASAKVFLFDTRHLEGLWRVGSFLGLGLTLMGLGYVWQRWVFGKKAAEV